MASKDLEEAFANLEKELKTDVDSLVKWLHDSKLITDTKEEMEKAIALFATVGDSKKVKLDEFLNVVAQIALQLSKTLEDIAKRLMETPPASAKTSGGSSGVGECSHSRTRCHPEGKS